MAQQVKHPPAMQEAQEMLVQTLVQYEPQEKEIATDSSVLPEKSHGQRSLVGYSPKGGKE